MEVYISKFSDSGKAKNAKAVIGLIKLIPSKTSLVIFVLLSQLFSISQPIFTGRLIDSLQQRKFSVIATLLIVIFGSIVLAQFFDYLFRKQNSKSFSLFQGAIKNKIFSALQKMSLGDYDAKPEGFWISKIERDTNILSINWELMAETCLFQLF